MKHAEGLLYQKFKLYLRRYRIYLLRRKITHNQGTMLQVLLVLALAPTDIGTGTGWTPGYFTEPSDGADSIGGWGAAPPADPLCSIPRERWCVGDEEVYAKKNADGTRGGNVWGTSLYHTHSRKRTRAHVYDTALTSIPFYFPFNIYICIFPLPSLSLWRYQRGNVWTGSGSSASTAKVRSLF